MKNKKIIAVDLDRTLAHYESFSADIGEPIPNMISYVRAWLADGHEVVIFTARVSQSWEKWRIFDQTKKIEDWCEKHLGKKLRVTADKDPDFDVFFDDKAFNVAENLGEISKDFYSHHTYGEYN